MTRSIFLGSVLLCLLCVGLIQVSDPSVFGIHEEPERIMFYGGSGLIAGLSGIVAAFSGTYLVVHRFASISTGQRRFMVVIILMVLLAVLIAFVIRFYTA